MQVFHKIRRVTAKFRSQEMEKFHERPLMNISQDDLMKIRDIRAFRESMHDIRWYRSEVDPFDLRYLFDDEEVKEKKGELIRDYEWQLSVNPHYNPLLYHDDHEENDDEHNENNNPLIFAWNNEQLILEENWDYEESGVRYNFILNWSPEYDSGIDEPYLRHEPYLEVNDESENEEDQEIVNQRFLENFRNLHRRRMRQ